MNFFLYYVPWFYHWNWWISEATSVLTSMSIIASYVATFQNLKCFTNKVTLQTTSMHTMREDADTSTYLHNYGNL